MFWFFLIETLLPGAKGSGTIKCYTQPNHILLKKTLKYIFTSVMKLVSAEMSWSHAAAFWGGYICSLRPLPGDFSCRNLWTVSSEPGHSRGSGDAPMAIDQGGLSMWEVFTNLKTVEFKPDHRFCVLHLGFGTQLKIKFRWCFFPGANQAHLFRQFCCAAIIKSGCVAANWRFYDTL